MHKDGKWAQKLIAAQDPEGKWGQFHSMASSPGSKISTEMALNRLERLGFTIGDECIQKAVGYMTDCLAGRKSIPDPREKLLDWDIFTELMLAARIRRFTESVPEANAVAAKWAAILNEAFASGEYDHAAYVRAYQDVHGIRPHGGRLVDFVNFYPLSLLRGVADPETSQRMVKYALDHPTGIYYICEKPLRELPEKFEGKPVSRYLAAIELLAAYDRSTEQLSFVRNWLIENQCAPGKWDLGSAANDGFHFPLSDSWRKTETRIADCTERIERIIARIPE